MCTASLRPCRVTDQERHSRGAGAGALGREGPCPRVLEHRAQGGPLGMEGAFLAAQSSRHFGQTGVARSPGQIQESCEIRGRVTLEQCENP